MNSKTLARVGVVALVGTLAVAGAAFAMSGQGPSQAASECPGTIVCPQTGERICKDRCPLDGEGAEDCPGTIVCPLDGETICQDRCPATEHAAVESRACCNEP